MTVLKLHITMFRGSDNKLKWRLAWKRSDNRVITSVYANEHTLLKKIDWFKRNYPDIVIEEHTPC